MSAPALFQLCSDGLQNNTKHLSKNVFSPCVLIGCDGMLTCLFKMTENTSAFQGKSHFWDRLSRVIGSVITSTHLESEAATSQS